MWKLPGYHAFSNELDEMLERWPVYQSRTVALLAVRQAFFINGATHWDVGAYRGELLVNPDVAAREAYPELAARYERNLAMAKAALVERARRKQGPPTGKRSHRGNTRREPKCILFK